MQLPDYKANEYQKGGMTYSRATHVDPNLLGASDSDARRRMFLSENCKKLADLLEHHIPNQNHDQQTWTNYQASECGTTGCALGWAAMMHIIPGLQHRLKYGNHGVAPTINGVQEWNWHAAGAKFFGEQVLQDVFLDVKASKARTIAKLRRWARTYRKAP